MALGERYNLVIQCEEERFKIDEFFPIQIKKKAALFDPFWAGFCVCYGGGRGGGQAYNSFFGFLIQKKQAL